MKPKYSVGDVFYYGDKSTTRTILSIWTEFYDETGLSKEPYYTLTSFYKGYPPSPMRESHIDLYYTKM